MRKLRGPLLVASLVTACGGSAQTRAPVQAPAPEAPAAETPATPARPAAAADATPDPYRGHDPRDAELAKAASAVLEAFFNDQPRFTRDGKQLVFVSDRDGLPQLYLADAGKPDAQATRLLTTSERMWDPLVTPDGRSVIFVSDEGADEHWAFFRVDLDGKNLVELTPARLSRDTPILVDARPDTLFYSGRAMSDVATTVYSTSATAAGEEKVIYRDEKPGGLVDVSPDGESGLFLRYPSREENYLVVLDLATGKARPLYPASGKLTIASASFSADGKRVYVGTDAGAEQALLLALDAASGKEVARYVESEPATATIAGLEVARKGNLIALALDAGNRSELRLLDARTLEPRAAVALPLGSGYPGEFSEDAGRLALVWSTPNAPGDIFAIDTGSGELSLLRQEVRPGLDALPAVQASIVELDAFDGGRIPANVFLPAGTQHEELPVLVHYHGGPSSSSAIGWSFWARFFVGLGYAWVEPNVRGSSGFGRAFEAADNGPNRLDAFEDVESAGRWAASQPWADEDRMVVYGGSYGGYTVLIALCRMPDLWRAGVDLVGVVNLETFMASTTGFIREIFLVEFGDPDEDTAFLASISPLTDVDKIVDPLFVYTGANDPRVPRSESDLIVKALRARRIPVEYMVKDNEGHSLDRRENQIEFFVRVARFLEKHLE